MFGMDSMEVPSEINYMHQQIFAQNIAKMATIPADGKVHTYENKFLGVFSFLYTPEFRIPGGMSKRIFYHKKGPNHEEFTESHLSSQSFG